MNKVSVVLGAGFGDEGKGMVVDYLCSQLPSNSKGIVIRFSGGHQAGHNVVLPDGRNHIHSNFGSGTLRGVPTYWDRYCTVDPVGLIREMKVLEKLGVTPTLYLNKDCPVTTPSDKFDNKYRETFNKHGSCGVGFGSTIQREEDMYKLHIFDMEYDNVFKKKVSIIRNKYYRDESSFDEFYSAVKTILKCPNIIFVDELPEEFEYKIYEGSQGLLLDKDIGFFPHVTRSNTDISNIILEVNGADIYFVTRAYATRHGNGPFNDASVPEFTDKINQETNKTNEYQGEFKKATLDVDLLAYGIDKMYHEYEWFFRDSSLNLVVTCLDHLKSPYPLETDGYVHSWVKKENFVKAVASYITKFDKVFYNESPVGDLKSLEV